jgi:DNA-binding transcriptional MerR regulator
MSSIAIPKDAATGAVYPIRTVADLTGVNAITLRAWERRYGLFEPVRKASGHRLYRQEHIDLINRVVGLLERGMRIGQVKTYLAEEQSRSESGAERAGDGWSRYLNHMVAAVIQFDEAGLEETYGEALSLYPVEAVTENLLTPLLRELGRRWQQGEGSVAEEHFFAFYMRNKLGARFHHRVRTRRGPTLLLACLPGDRHETGLLLFALAANEAGFVTVMLGADMPLDELPAAARKTRCDAIVLSGLVPPEARTMKTGLPALVADAGVPVFIGGKVSVTAHDHLKRTGAEPLGIDVHKGIRQVAGTLKYDLGDGD